MLVTPRPARTRNQEPRYEATFGLGIEGLHAARRRIASIDGAAIAPQEIDDIC